MTRPQHSPRPTAIGAQIREWRKLRRLSQLDFALEADISQKHLSFIESGRSAPSRDMVLRLAERLQVPLRERNTLVLAAGFAPVFPERDFNDLELAPARETIKLILKGHEPFPAIAVDRHWTLIIANMAASSFFSLVQDKGLLQPPVNVLRVSLSPGGLAPHIRNLQEWREHVLGRLRHQVSLTADIKLTTLLDELKALDHGSAGAGAATPIPNTAIAIPLQLDTPAGLLSFISTTTVFGTPVDITLSEIALETFFPANAETGLALNRMANAP